MAPYMPHDIAYRRTKIGFNTPIVEWMKGPLKDYFKDITGSVSFANCDLIDPVSVRTQIDEVIEDPKATFAMGERAFMNLYPYLWEQNFLKRA
jgi:asparagine synthase (glutamine-hydrolysing)